MAYSPRSSPAAGEVTSAQAHLRTQAGRSLEQATGLNTLLPEVNLNPWGSVQLMWLEGGRVYYESGSFHQ